MVRISWFFIRIIQERDEKKQKKTAGFPRVNQKSPAQAMQDSVGNASILPYICINQAWFPRKMAGIDDVYIIYSGQIKGTSHELGPQKVAGKWNKPTILILSKAGHPWPTGHGTRGFRNRPPRRRSIKPSEFRRFYDRGDLPIQAAALFFGCFWCFLVGQKKGSWN